MIKTLKIIAAELKRANDLKERDIKNKETWGWYMNPSPFQTSPEVVDNIHTGGISYSKTIRRSSTNCCNGSIIKTSRRER